MIEVIIPREEFPIKTIAIVRAKSTGRVHNAPELREAITAAVTEWHASDCPEAKKSWEYAGDDFNIGDLEGYHEAVDCALPSILEKHGVKGLEISIADVNDSSSEWNFDTPLTDYNPDEEDE